MRFDPQGDASPASELLRTLTEDQLAALLRELGDEPHARKIARAVVRRREEGRPVITTGDLRELVEVVRPRRPGRPGAHLHPATRTFQALRMAVNRELEGLAEFIGDAVRLLAPGGRLVVISFHGGEDRIVKNALRDLAGRCTCAPHLARCECGKRRVVELLTKKPLRPTSAEVAGNPRARSARLRAAERVAA